MVFGVTASSKKKFKFPLCISSDTLSGTLTVLIANRGIFVD